MKELVWSELLSVDIEEIDEDHRKLLDLFNILNHAISDGDTPEYQVAVLEELINCTIWHFSHEERLMLKYDYADIDEHKAAHQELIDSAMQLEKKILQADSSIEDEDVAFLERWLTEHILTDDNRLGVYLSRVM